MFDFRYYIDLLTEAVYDPIVHKLKRLFPDKHELIDQQVSWAKTIFPKSDQVTWYLKILEAYLNNELTGQLLGDYEFRSLEQFQTDISHFFGYQSDQVRNYQFQGKTISRVINELSELEQAWQAKQNAERGVDPQPGDYKLFEFKDGTAWWYINRAYCPEEGRSGKHCGNVTGQEKTDQRILSLRNNKNQVILTFILEPDHTLGEMKAKGNQKPQERYHPHILQLLFWPHIFSYTTNSSDQGIEIRGISGQGYLPDANFSAFDLNEKQLRLVKQEKPNLIADQVKITPQEILRAPEDIQAQYKDIAIQQVPGLASIIEQPDDIEAWYDATEQNPELLIYLPQQLWSDYYEFEKQLIEVITEENKRENFLLLKAPKTISKNPQFLEKIVEKSPSCIKQVQPTVKNYQQLAKTAVRKDPHTFIYIDANHKDEEMSKYAVQKYCWNIEFVPTTIKNYQELANIAFNQNPQVYNRIDKNYRTDEMAEPAIEAAPHNIEHISTDNKNYRNLALLAVKKDPGTFSLIDPAFRDEELSEVAVEYNYTNIYGVPNTLKNYTKLLKLAITYEPQIFSAIDAENINEEIARFAVKKDPANIRYVPTTVNNYEDIALSAVQQDYNVFSAIPIEYRNEQITIAALSKSAYNIHYINPHFKLAQFIDSLTDERKKKELNNFLLRKYGKAQNVPDRYRTAQIINDIKKRELANTAVMDSAHIIDLTKRILNY